ncbi:A disintegrin and metalloproteinase with thrombospondin motifs 9-like, partial [Saccostrea cucullata]|uniref:A disintegrin and metalloproteinase with thrombospondin motifs 9-like n=1 Tax=Saccostrea cuccullata TaxID=36930 RepID=UPI002ED2E72E
IQCMNLRKTTVEFTLTETIAVIWNASFSLCSQSCFGNDVCIGIIYSNTLEKCRLQGVSSSGVGTQIDADAVFFEIFEKRIRKFNPASCFEIKKCSPSSNDGEYWLFPERFDRQTPLKIYCHNMTSPETATEYLTLPKENYFIRHDSTHWKEAYQMCSRNSNPLMRTVFSKIKIDIKSLSIKQDDFTFANTTGTSAVENVPFGTTNDCTATKTWYYANNQPCQLFARFQIDLQGTGVAISKSTTWGIHTYDGKLLELSRSPDSTRVTCHLFGWCAECFPKTNITVEPMHGSVVYYHTAKRINCDEIEGIP